MIIKLWKDFNKRKNSTKQPSDSTAESLNVVLKEGTSIESPVFILKSNEFSYNYCQAFGHYYFITDIVSEANGYIRISCAQDLLATYKANILNTTAFVAFDTTANTEIVDSRLSVVSTPTVSSHYVAIRDDVSNAGVAVVTLLGADGVGSYIIPVGNISDLIPDFNSVYESFLSEDNPYGAYKALITGLMKTGNNASEYIKDIKLIPFNLTSEEGSLVYPLKLGNYELTIGGHKISARTSKKYVVVAIPWQYEDWRNNSPYTSVHMYIPWVGNVQYPASQLMDVNYLCIVTSLDRVTGDMVVVVRKGNTPDSGEVIGSYGASTAASLIIGKSGIDAMNAVTGLTKATVSVAYGSVGGMIGAGLDAIVPYATTVGGISNSAAIALDNYVHIYTVCHDTNVEPSSVSAVMGTPTFANKSLSSLTGYVKCEGASVNMAGLDSDKDAINSYLNTGFFIE